MMRCRVYYNYKGLHYSGVIIVCRGIIIENHQQNAIIDDFIVVINLNFNGFSFQFATVITVSVRFFNKFKRLNSKGIYA